MAAAQPRTRPRVNTIAANPRPKSTVAPNPNHDNGGALYAASEPPLSVFLTNLRLLDLDLLPDWPDITTETFATTGVQGQKRRIQCVEWVLVKLFGIWDPEETCSKLNPFFPPHDQMQSVNLRAALMRALDTVKKNGFLGRDSVIRKTMLDDCKGERLEEVLAYFSTAVLKRVVQQDMKASRQHPPIAVSLALENRGYDSDNTELQVLNLAYRVSLRRLLAQKEEARALYRDFGDLLSVKERGVTRRMEAVRAKEADSGRDTLSKNAREEMRRLVRDNWSGNEKWMETLLKGDRLAQEERGLLSMPFDRVWRRVQQGRLAEVEEESGGLLEQLENRVRVQKDRLARWDSFRKSALGQLPGGSASPSKRRDVGKEENRGIDFQFSAHHDLQVGTSSRSLGNSTHGGKKSRASESYEQLLSRLKDDLARIKKVDSTALNFPRETESHGRALVDPADGQSGDGAETVSEMSELEDEPFDTVTTPIPVRTNRTRLESLRRHPVKPLMRPSEVFNQSSSTHSSSSPPPQNEELTRRNEKVRAPPADDVEELEPPPSPTQNMADEILEAMDHASPSPALRPRQRPMLSLAQRTRLSMAGNHTPFLDEEPESPLRGLASSQDDAGPTPSSELDTKKGDSEIMDLASRTRLSMAGLEQAQKRAQLERRKSQSRSKGLPVRKEGRHFAKVEERDEEHDDREALTRELMMEEDMEAVFKSRPRMRTSPVWRPTKEW